MIWELLSGLSHLKGKTRKKGSRKENVTGILGGFGGKGALGCGYDPNTLYSCIESSKNE